MPVVGLDHLMHVAGDHVIMVAMLDEFVRTAAMQLGAVRNAFLIDEPHNLLSSCEVIRSVARKIGAVWLVRAASHLRRLLAITNQHARRPGLGQAAERQLHDDRLAALRACDEEVQVIRRCAIKMRQHLDTTSVTPHLHGGAALPALDLNHFPDMRPRRNSDDEYEADKDLTPHGHSDTRS